MGIRHCSMDGKSGLGGWKIQGLIAAQWVSFRVFGIMYNGNLGMASADGVRGAGGRNCPVVRYAVFPPPTTPVGLQGDGGEMHL